MLGVATKQQRLVKNHSQLIDLHAAVQNLVREAQVHISITTDYTWTKPQGRRKNDSQLIDLDIYVDILGQM
jgi:hypothetical protein